MILKLRKLFLRFKCFNICYQGLQTSSYIKQCGIINMYSCGLVVKVSDFNDYGNICIFLFTKPAIGFIRLSTHDE